MTRQDSTQQHPAAQKQRGETLEMYEGRAWPFKLWVDKELPSADNSTPPDGHVVIRSITISNMLVEAAKALKKPTKGRANYGPVRAWPWSRPRCVPPCSRLQRSERHQVGQAIMRMDPDLVRPQYLHVPSTGIPGSGKRVLKVFPRITDWIAEVHFSITDDSIPREVFHEHLEYAGERIGFGFWRKARGGHNGTFVVASPLIWS